MQLINESSRIIEINGKDFEVNIEIHAESEQDSVEGSFDFGNKEDNEEYLKRFENGELENIIIRVQASFNGVVGVDYLGACHVTSDDYCLDIDEIVKSNGMVDEAIADLKRQLNNLLKSLGGAK